ncbi:MAG: di-trans,poly-cis-decaprenylcistransferase [Candidatus Portnoybacteria bacterium]|nr:di-trans,poly-cis-decaprenylcistransferase [Candidatus Portnoybacteria bacterium]
MEKLPKHIAIIPDGNRRWAKKKGFLPWVGHRFGVKSLEQILKAADDLNISCLTIWGGSYDNLTKRPEKETKFLKEIYRLHFKRLLKNKNIYKKKVRVDVFGRWQEVLSERVKKPIIEAIEKTKSHDQHFLNFLIGYNGTDEMMDSIKKIAKSARKEANLEITPELVKANLWTKNLPPVDLVIRTGVEGDPHNSNGFMMWDTSDSQFYFTETLWPDFSQEEFQEAIESYAKRERRLGA